MPTHRAPLFVIAALLLALPLAGCGEDKTSKAAAAPPPPPQVTVAKPTKAGHLGPRRICRPLRCLRLRRGALARIGLPRDDPLHGRPDRQRGRSAVHHRSAAVPSCARSGKGRRGAGEGQSRFCGSRSEARRKSGARHDHHAANVRSAHRRPSAWPRRRDGAGGRHAAGRTRSRSLRELTSPVSGRIGDRRVSVGNLVTGGTTGSTTLLATIASIDPIRFEFTMDEASYLRYLRAAGGEMSSSSADRGMTLPVKLKLIDEKDFTHEGQDRLRRQRHRPLVRHHPRPRRVHQRRRAPDARHVRAHPDRFLGAG